MPLCCTVAFSFNLLTPSPNSHFSAIIYTTIFMKIKVLISSASLLLLVIVYLCSFIFSYDRILHNRDELLITDVARLVPIKVHSVDKLNTTEDLKRIIADAKKKGL